MSKKAKNIVYIISDINKALAFEWIVESIDSSRFRLGFVLINNEESELERYLKAKGLFLARYRINSKRDYIKTLFAIYRLLIKINAEVVHTHLLKANIVGITAAWLARVKKRIYTRHHSSFHHIYYPSKVRIDRIINGMATDIVAISRNVESILKDWEGVDQRKIILIRHGFMLEAFDEVAQDRISALKDKYEFADDMWPVLGVIARYTEWKGIQYIIPAFRRLLSEFPKAHLILANAQGDYAEELQVLLSMLPEKSYTEITFENDIPALYKMFDVYVHTPVDSHSEAFGQTYVEALAAGVPSVFTLSGIAPEFIKDRVNALLVPYRDSESIYKALCELLNDEKEMQRMKKAGREAVYEAFHLKEMIENLELLYEQ